MNLFDKDGKKQKKQFFKHFWDFADETKQSQQTYLNTEAEMWKDDLEKKAQAYLSSDKEAIDLQMKEYYESLEGGKDAFGNQNSRAH